VTLSIVDWGFDDCRLIDDSSIKDCGIRLTIAGIGEFSDWENHEWDPMPHSSIE
jgi:hypothetical protein